MSGLQREAAAKRGRGFYKEHGSTATDGGGGGAPMWWSLFLSNMRNFLWLF